METRERIQSLVHLHEDPNDIFELLGPLGKAKV